MIGIPTVVGAPPQRTAGVAERVRHNGDPIAWVAIRCPVARPKKFGAVLLAELLMFLQDHLAVVRLTIFFVVGPWFRGMLGTELRDPIIGEFGGGERMVSVANCFSCWSAAASGSTGVVGTWV